MYTYGNMWAKKKQTGFTIVELLIVIVVIAILAAITIVAYNGVQERARDTRRAQDLANIYKALLVYEAVNGGVPSTYTAGAYAQGVTYGGWDASVSPNWLAFLRPSNGTMPIDPVNTLVATNNAPATTNRVYYYYCYKAGNGPLPATDNVRIGYTTESGVGVDKRFAVASCL